LVELSYIIHFTNYKHWFGTRHILLV
jgi:hypothetical protein